MKRDRKLAHDSRDLPLTDFIRDHGDVVSMISAEKVPCFGSPGAEAERNSS